MRRTLESSDSSIYDSEFRCKKDCFRNALFSIVNSMTYLPPANEVWGKVILLHLSVILFTGVGLQAHTQGGVEGSGWGGLQAHTQGGWLRGLAWGVSRPTPRKDVEGSGRGVQAHTQGVSPGPHPGVQGPRGCIPACSEADTPPTSSLEVADAYLQSFRANNENKHNIT